MQKKLLAVAVAAALAPAAAMAQVEIYGRANIGLDNWRATGATLAAGTANFGNRARVFEQGSRLGFRINEKLDGGMRAFAVIESGVNLDTGNPTNLGQNAITANASTGVLASRDSYAGIGGGWGDVRFGRQSIWWSNGTISQTGANYINTAADGLITAAGLVAAPVTRQSNVIAYNSPTAGGFNGTVSWSPGNNESSTYTGTSQTKDGVWGVTARYSVAPFTAQFDWADRKNAGTNFASNPSRNRGMKMGLAYSYAAGSQVGYVHANLRNGNSVAVIGNTVAVGDNLTQKVNLLNWEHMAGQWQLLAQYAWSSSVSGATGADVSGTKFNGTTLGAKYHLSKRTGVYATLNTVKNGSNQYADLSGGGYSSGPLTATHEGADVRIIGLGMMHNF